MMLFCLIAEWAENKKKEGKMPERKTFEVIKKDTQADFLKRVENLTKEIKFGSITIHVEDGRIIQIDKNEKIRFK